MTLVKNNSQTAVVDKIEGTEVSSIKNSDRDTKTKLLYDIAADSEDKYLHSLIFVNWTKNCKSGLYNL